MDDMIYLLFLSVSVPVLLMILLVEKKARLPMIFVLVGMYISVLASEVNGLLSGLMRLEPYRLTIVVTPITEEVLKALPVLFYAVVICDKKESLFTAAMATGIGFAILENGVYLLSSHSLHLTGAAIRAFGTGLMHGLCTLLVGVGISFVRKRKKTFAVGTFALLSTAITYHGIYNMLIQSQLTMLGVLLPIVTYGVFLLRRLSLRKRAAKV